MSELQVGRVLFTKDGRRFGNAVIEAEASSSVEGEIYLIRTDFGNTVVMNKREINAAFYESISGFESDIEVIDCTYTRLQDQLDKLNAITRCSLILENIPNR